MKDMPSDVPAGLCIGAVPERETPKDVLISRNGSLLSQLPAGARIGTSSLRRAAQLRHLRPDIVILPLRGNLDTRLKKLETENLDAVVLAAAGVIRLGLEARITEYIDEEIMLPAVGQGALCVEIRENDPAIAPLVDEIDHPDTRSAVLGERAFLSRLEGGCQVPIAAHGTISENTLRLTGLVANVEGTTLIKDTISGPETEAGKVGLELANRLLARGARKILDDIYIHG
jgi:hydroxymethylbilane synthase